MGDHRDRVGLPLDPGIGNPHDSPLQALHPPAPVHTVHPVGVIHHHLRDGHRLGTAVHHAHLHHAGLRQPDALEGELLHRREGGAKHAHGPEAQEGKHQRGQEHQGTFAETQAAGDYTIRVRAAANGQALGEAEGRFLVVDQDIELDNPIADVDVMAGLAAATAEAGGEALAPEALPALFDRLAEQTIELQEPLIRRVPLYDNWPFFLLFVGVIGVEWFLRKKWGLV